MEPYRGFGLESILYRGGAPLFGRVWYCDPTLWDRRGQNQRGTHRPSVSTGVSSGLWGSPEACGGWGERGTAVQAAKQRVMATGKPRPQVPELHVPGTANHSLPHWNCQLKGVGAYVSWHHPGSILPVMEADGDYRFCRNLFILSRITSLVYKCLYSLQRENGLFPENKFPHCSCLLDIALCFCQFPQWLAEIL